MQCLRTSRRRIANHVSSHLDADGERWLRQGVTYIKSSTECPFCQQELRNRKAIDLYKEYFSQAYKKHTLQIVQATDQAESDLSDEVRVGVHKVTWKTRPSRAHGKTWLM